MNNKTLISRKRICEFLGIGNGAFYNLVKAGLPVSKLNGSWIGNADNLNVWSQGLYQPGGLISEKDLEVWPVASDTASAAESVLVYCSACRKWIRESGTRFVNIEEDMEGRDKLTFICPDCGKKSTSIRRG